MESNISFLSIILFISTTLKLATGTISIQSGTFCSICTHPDKTGCRNPYYTSYNFQSKDYEDIRSQDSRYYENGRRCIVSIKARPNHQIQLIITELSLDSRARIENGRPVLCHDSLKLYNGPTVDNARLFPGIPPTGICGKLETGSELGDLTVFKTTQNELTILFETDNIRDELTGFQIQITQNYRANPGNLYPTGGNPGGWNDGTFNEFQMNWDDQVVIPGGEVPGGDGTDFDKDKNGISCYECNFCPVEPYDPVQQGGNTKTGCHTCSKEWDNEYQQAQRKCYSYTQYYYKLEQLKFGGSDTVESYTGCKQFINNFGRRVNYCFCNENNCNKGNNQVLSPVLFICGIVIFILEFLS
ncbi:hypothetical protein KUTeg_007957 [Tegillarca granosa]|uniref:CUB domain-containing protein n=1 Tax=Tegillarca granosa TaxID=220873 RepID=A0ABQ9FIP3_TEGGR|nr:hypothetical protein KUTeg_007957 [Tegillarca granosa]